MMLNQLTVGAALALIVCAFIFFYVRNDMNKTRNISPTSDVLQAFAGTVGGSYSYSGFGFKHTVKWNESGVPVELVRSSKDDPVSGNESSINATCVLQTRAPLQFHVESRLPAPGGISIALGNRGGSSLVTEVLELDTGYSTRASDVQRARQLLRQPQVWKALVALNAPGAYLDVSVQGAGVHVAYGDEVGTLDSERLMNIRALFGAIILQLKDTG